jgi:hypothetical protein
MTRQPIDMNQSEANEMIMNIGAMIINDVCYLDGDWNALALVGDLSDGQRGVCGYQYFPDGTFAAKIPKKFSDVLYKLSQLREATHTEEGVGWHQCLIHITKPGMNINIQFEYDDPNRWSLGSVSLDMSEYAESLKPPM